MVKWMSLLSLVSAPANERSLVAALVEFDSGPSLEGYWKSPSVLR
jgi:hypothetical protein